MEYDQQISFEEQKALCPIHKWANVDDYLEHARVPEYYRVPFHKLVIARGLYSKIILEEDAKKFAAEARRLALEYEFTPIQARTLMPIFFQLIVQWQTSRG